MIREPIRRLTMRVSLSALCLVIWATSVTAQTKNEEKKPGDSPWSTGRTVLPDNKGQLQPQGWTGPLSTGSENAPPESPQGGTPPPCSLRPAARPSRLSIPRLPGAEGPRGFRKMDRASTLVSLGPLKNRNLPGTVSRKMRHKAR
jgi:hypothetical protein